MMLGKWCYLDALIQTTLISRERARLSAQMEDHAASDAERNCEQQVSSLRSTFLHVISGMTRTEERSQQVRKGAQET